MIYVAICILLSLSFYLTFRLVPRFKLDILQVITVNYWVCVLCGLWFSPDFWQVITEKQNSWLSFALFQGSLFIGIFYITAYLSVAIGIGYTGLMGKISVFIPILFSALYFRFPMTSLQYLGIALALSAIVLIHYQPTQHDSTTQKVTTKQLFLGLVLLFGSGLIDINFKWFEHFYSRTVPTSYFAIICFGTSAVIGGLVVGYQYIVNKQMLLLRNLIAGIGLGVPNYFSVVVLTKGLQNLPPATFFMLNNVGLLAVVNLVGFLLFRERFSVFKWFGLVLAISAIGLLVLS